MNTATNASIGVKEQEQSEAGQSGQSSTQKQSYWRQNQQEESFENVDMLVNQVAILVEVLKSNPEQKFFDILFLEGVDCCLLQLGWIKRENVLRITLWGSVASELGRELDQLNGQNTLLVLTSLSTYLWNNTVNGSSTFLTNIYINLDIPEAIVFSDRYKLQFDIQDEDDYIKVILFDSQVQILLENTAAITKEMYEKLATIHQTPTKQITSSTMNTKESEATTNTKDLQEITNNTTMQGPELKKNSTKRARKVRGQKNNNLKSNKKTKISRLEDSEVEEINSTPLKSIANLPHDYEQQMENGDKQFQQIRDAEDDRLLTFTRSVIKKLFQTKNCANTSNTNQNEETTESVLAKEQKMKAKQKRQKKWKKKLKKRKKEEEEDRRTRK
ncbi:hypothetical protein GIB67_030584 [Kingdonia uniflora]|uniref:Uncharacterized protein n=1 Tax=Kingdonia uniflora TaxID=39325 RepID=A0A7J7PBS9_9MAGN|nr:hypothetical protein GIB67_030584 [Kingdonia uniflora]